MLVVVALAGCGAPAGEPPPAAAPSAAPGEACLPLPALDAPPERVVTMDGGAAAVLVRLGVGDRIVGTSAPDFIADFDGAERAELDAIPVLDPRQGNAEVVVAAEPDLVLGISALSFGGFDGTPTPQRLAASGAAAFAACDVIGDGPVVDIEAGFRFVEQVAGLMGVAERGAEVVAALRAETDAAAATAPAEPVRVLALSGPPAPGQPLRTLGGRGFTNGVLTLAGGANVAGDVAADFTSLSAEEAVARDPQAIVVISGIGPDRPEDVREAIRTSPVLAATTAVRENRLVVVPQSLVLSPSLRNADAVATIAAGIGAP